MDTFSVPTRVPPNRPPFAVMLTAMRERRRISQSALARASGLNYSHISRLESGSRRPTPATIAFIVEALELPPVEATGLYIAAFVPLDLRASVGDVLRQDGAR